MSARIGYAFLGLSVAATATYLLLASAVAQAAIYDGLGAVVAVAILAGVAAYRPSHPLPWYLFAAGMALQTAGDVVWDVYELGLRDDPFPSAADAFYLAAYLPLLAGLVLMVRRLGAGQSHAALTDALIVAVGLAVPTWVFVIDPYFEDSTSTVLERGILVSYPGFDVLLLVVLARLLFVPGARTGAFRLLALALAFLLGADLTYAGVSNTYDTGDWVDAGWLLSDGLWGAAALLPSMTALTRLTADREPRLTVHRLLLLAAALLLPPAVLIVQDVRGEPVDLLELAPLAGALSLLVLWRMAGLVRQLERLRREERAASERIRDLVGGLNAIVWEADTDPLELTFIGGQIEEILGYPRERWAESPLFWQEIVHPDDRTQALAVVRRAISARWDYVSEYRVVTAGGDVVWVRDVVRYVEATPERPAHLRGVCVDITQRKRVESDRESLLVRERASRAEAEDARAALAAQNEQLLELDRLKDEFVALVSHELRSPLTSIRGYVELLLEGHAGELSDEQREFLGVVERGADRLLHLVSDLLFVAQVQAGALALDLDDVDLTRVARQAVEAARPLASEKGVTLELEVEELPALLGDGGRISQLMDNLLSNALKFTPEGGTVTVVVGANGDAFFEIRDTGIGISPAEQERLFERFFRSSEATKRAIPGTGLGLGIAKAIVDAHDGRIELESAEGVGTTFRVFLPFGKPRRRRERPERAVA